MRTRSLFGIAGLIAGLIWLAGLPARADAPVVAAASDLKFALEEIASAYREETGREVQLTFGSSGNFARQIRDGAPFGILMSADEQYVLDLARDGYTEDEGMLYAEGRIVLIVPKGSPLRPDGSLDDLAAALADGRLVKFAIANPEHAPYGLRAREALEHRGLWDAIVPHLVLGENISQAAQFATSGNAQGGIIAYSLALAEEVGRRGDYALIPAEWHEPLLQRMVLLKAASPDARAFYDYLSAPRARAILVRYGFSLPAEAPASG